MEKMRLWVILFVLLVSAGCAKEQIYQSSPSMQTVSTQHYEVKLELSVYQQDQRGPYH